MYPNTMNVARVSGLRNWQLYDTIIVKHFIDTGTISLYSGGFNTALTRKRINQILKDAGVQSRVIQRQGKWYVKLNGDLYEFFEGITVYGYKESAAYGGETIVLGWGRLETKIEPV